MNELPFTAFDLLVGAAIVISALLALARGLFREIVGLASLVAAAVIAWLSYGSFEPLLREATGSAPVAGLVTAVGVFVIPLLILRTLGNALAGAIAAAGLGPVDKALGLGFGLARGAALVCIAYLLGTVVTDPATFPPWVTRAALEPPVRGGATWIAGFLPPNFAHAGRASVEQAVERARDGRVAEPAAAPASQPATAEPWATETEPAPPAGYQKGTRQTMDDLFEKVR